MRPAMAANFALPETKFARFRLSTEIKTRSYNFKFGYLFAVRA